VVIVRRRDVWLADLREPVGSEAGYLRPVIIVQSDAINASRLTTYLAVPVTGLEHRVAAPWNYPLRSAATTGLRKASIAQTNLMLAVNERQLIERLGEVTMPQLRQLLDCLDIALGRA
jgi:mRNA interferase MazF